MAQADSTPRPGHRLELLCGATQYCPALVEAIDAAVHTVLLETYIFDFTRMSLEVAYALERAARRGVIVRIAVDGFGTADIPGHWQERFLQTGVQLRVFRRLGWLGMAWPGNWSRLHRKLCVVDGVTGFCGGINLLDDLFDPNHGVLESPRFDFAVRVAGPLVAQIETTMNRLWMRMQAVQDMRHARLAGAITSLRAAGAQAPLPQVAAPDSAHLARAAFVLRDNVRNRSSIERSYRRAIATARDEIIIANAYFVPGRKLRRALIEAAGRGVKVRLLLQGRYEYFMQYYAARPVYGALLEAGVEIHEYSASFLHAKVAVIDSRWATVGSSNLDPLSLLLAREANLVVEDAEFAVQLRSQLVHAIDTVGGAMSALDYANRPFRQRVFERVALVVMRVLLLVQGKHYL
ncbi:cardiolipin synthase ClsB [Caenimonas koreensis DSM 17982]|uniref:Cardiolipin synthase B n=1 Tax=Caenimonas koreensis DSM 17982 TaxID=1121255 RepID=A0A844AZI3_9BURK|nr:cardiolipin synthase ClsB [Caenimonas koreensis]MRD46243.1 cardiolipin synthase ClsB [Caenimonas koreensis DSM 17982]